MYYLVEFILLPLGGGPILWGVVLVTSTPEMRQFPQTIRNLIHTSLRDLPFLAECQLKILKELKL